MPKNPSRRGNRVLSLLSPADFKLLELHLEPVDLPVLKPLETRNSRIDGVYFIDQGFASVVNGRSKNEQRLARWLMTAWMGTSSRSVLLGQWMSPHLLEN